MTAEMVLELVNLTVRAAKTFRGTAKFADGTALSDAHIEQAFKAADAPWQRIEDRARAELDKTPKS